MRNTVSILLVVCIESLGRIGPGPVWLLLNCGLGVKAPFAECDGLLHLNKTHPATQNGTHRSDGVRPQNETHPRKQRTVVTHAHFVV